MAPSLLLGGFAFAAVAHAIVLVPRAAPWPVPTPQQLAYQGEISGLIHFNMATFMHDGDPGCTKQNWLGCDNPSDTSHSCNSSRVESFAPTNLNVSQWVESLLAIGATHAVLTAKHGCGFLLWPTKQQLPDGSAYRYHVPETMNVLEQFASTMAANGLGAGFYYSLTNNFYLNTFGHKTQPPSTLIPGQASVTQAQYEALSLALMTEIWGDFGPLMEIWLDGGCGSMCDSVNALLNKMPNARNAVAFNGGGGTSANAVRWCGTEGGSPSGVPTVWSTADCGWCPDGSGSGAPPNSTAASWYPSGVDVTIQLGDRWFIEPGQPLHSLSDLVTMYQHSVGANGHLEIDFAIDRTGQLAPAHVAKYAQFGAWIRSCYGTPVATGTMPAGGTSFILPIGSGSSGAAIDRVMLREDQRQGQFVIAFTLEAQAPGSTSWVPFSSGVTIGSKRIDISAAPVTVSAVRLTIVSAFAPGSGSVTVSAFAPEGCVVVNDE